MITDYQKNQVVEWTNQTIDKLGMAYCLKGKIAIQWNPTFTRRMGDAHYHSGQRYARIRFSIPLWNLASEQERYNTVVHEVCHIVDFWKKAHLPGYQSTLGHGHKWQLLMLTCGVNPDVYHRVKRPPELKRKVTTYKARCACREFEITAHRVSKMRNGASYMCRSCCTTISLI